jgi:EcsC protein family
MLVETSINGKDALIAYIKVGGDGEFIPVNKKEATLAKIVYEDGGNEFVLVKDGEIQKRFTDTANDAIPSAINKLEDRALARPPITMAGDDSDYEREQRKAIDAWKTFSPSLVERTLGYALMPVGWVVQTIVPPSAIEGALRSADWLARQTISEDWVLSKTDIKNVNDKKHRRLREVDSLADSFHRWQVGYAVAEGAAAGFAGLPGLAVDVPSLITLTLRTVRGIGVCYGFGSDSEAEREFVLAVIAAAGANSITEKTAALLFLQKLKVLIATKAFKKMAAQAAQQAISKEAAIIALRDLARQLGVNLTKRKMLQTVPFLGAGIGAAVNWKFMDDVAWAARRAYQERWLQDRVEDKPNPDK